MRTTILIVAASGVLVLVGCAQQVDGTGAGSGGVSTPRSSPRTVSAPPSSALPTTFPSATATPPATHATTSSASASPTASASATVVPAVGVRCPTRRVTATGAPFCFTLPAGFTDYSTLPDYGAGWTWRTLVSVGKHDLIEVLAARLAVNTDTLGAAALLKQYRSLSLIKGKFKVVQAGTSARVRLDGAQAFTQNGRFSDGVGTTQVVAFRGHAVLTMRCQFKAHRQQVVSACANVLSTLDFVRL